MNHENNHNERAVDDPELNRAATRADGLAFVPEGTLNDTADVLNELIEVNRDAHKGYEAAAEEVEWNEAKDLFHKYAAQRESFNVVLGNLVVANSGEPETSGNAAALFHRAWINIKGALTSGDEAILEECILGEEKALEAYNDAAEKDYLPENVLEVVRVQLQEVQDALEKLRHMATVVSS